MLGVFRFSKRITGFILVTFPGILALLKFFLKIDTFEDLANIYPGISGIRVIHFFELHVISRKIR